MPPLSDSSSPKTKLEEWERSMKKGLASDIVLLASLEERFVAISFLSSRDGPDGRGGLFAYLDLLSTLKEKMYFLAEGVWSMLCGWCMCVSLGV